ncbi:MAG: CHAT domain-containing protein [Bacteroidetes bacterium]|nr:CHAT domain-containing protein [Bacteroidota bacterium]
MKVFFFAFANQAENPLPNLQDEENEIYKLLSPGELDNRYLIHRDSFASRENIAYYLTQYRESIVVFHYAGHAGDDILFTEEDTTSSKGIAFLLGQCPHLQLVVLNGCSTQGQVQQLWGNNIPAIIATNSAVNDKKARQFSKRFYQALSLSSTLDEAFKQAKGAVLTMDAELNIQLHRGIKIRKRNDKKAAWGLFVQAERDDVLSWKIPQKVQLPKHTNFQPNSKLIKTLFNTLASCNRKIRFLFEEEEAGERVDIADKRLEILNCLPAPIAEQLRKLMVPLADRSKGYDKSSIARLKQLNFCFQIIAGFVSFSFIGQLWESLENNESLSLEPTLKSLIRTLLISTERTGFNYSPILTQLLLNFDKNEIGFFKSVIKNEPETLDKVSNACLYFSLLEQRLQNSQIKTHEVGVECERAEQFLSEFFEIFACLSKFTMVAVRDINLLKHRHLKAPSYRHSLIRQIKLMGGLENRNEKMKEALESNAVVLLKEEKDETSYLSLSPFIIDINAFEEGSNESVIYFFHHFEAATDRYFFLNALQENDPLFEIPKGDLDIFACQFNAFSKLFFNKLMPEL